MTNRERIMLMSRWKSILFGAALVMSPVSAHAQDQGAAPAAEPAADRLAAATQLMDLILPAAQRDAMVEQMMKAIMTTMTASLKDQPSFAAAMQNPKVETVFNRFIDRQRQQTAEQLKAGMPGMLTAMSRAYARRFTVPQLAEMHSFFSTPTGQAYVKESYGILSDPDIATWQRDLMAKGFARLPEEMKALQQELEGVLGKPLAESKS
ncbi:DUF2059 domain-containing protein [Sphingopyxis sp. 550A]